MNRRKLLAAGGVVATTLAGCTAVKEALLGEDTEDTAEPSADSGSQERERPDISADEVNSTDTPPEEREETTPENTTTEQDTADNASENTTPQSDPLDALEFVDHYPVYDEAQDPNYETNELAIEGTFRNTADHRIEDILIKGNVTVNDEIITKGQTEYIKIDGGERLPLRVQLEFKEEAIDGNYNLSFAAATWA